RITDIRLGDVSIDLSEEALKDDLVGKLKMLAITDSELRELFAMKNPAHIPHLIEYIMTKPEPMRLAFVAKEIGNYGDPAVVDTLASLLYHEDERVVLAAIQGLEATKSPAAVIPLCPFLRSEIPLYAQAARTALSKFGAVKIMQALKDLPTFTDIKLKEAGIFVLSRMKGDPVEKILKTLLNDESSSVRIQAILAMSYQKNPVYIDPLREFYRIANETEKSMTRKAIVYLNGFNK
ncbi:MAG: HEAT repeat domain-containing protein, partial [Candidatus Riflebacteria bacterium]|nr:HEAT repeat domain-containing protein [Candidatus Riflebacteria bacterium]